MPIWRNETPICSDERAFDENKSAFCNERDAVSTRLFCQRDKKRRLENVPKRLVFIGIC